MLPRALDAQRVTVKVVKVKLLVCPAFQENFKMCPVNLRVNSALKIRKVKKQIRLNATPVVQVKSQTKAVPNVLNVTPVKQELAQTMFVNHAHRANTGQVK